MSNTTIKLAPAPATQKLQPDRARPQSHRSTSSARKAANVSTPMSVAAVGQHRPGQFSDSDPDKGRAGQGSAFAIRGAAFRKLLPRPSRSIAASTALFSHDAHLFRKRPTAVSPVTREPTTASFCLPSSPQSQSRCPGLGPATPASASRAGSNYRSAECGQLGALSFEL